MTEENYKYRTNPMFLRNQFGNKIPTLEKITLNNDEIDGLRLIGFDKAKTNADTHFNRFVHFFLYDYKFEDIWNNPDKYIENLGELSPYQHIWQALTGINPTKKNFL